MIELIHGYATELQEVEDLVNDFIAKTDGCVIDVISQKKTKDARHINGAIETMEIIFVVEYDGTLKDWHKLFNYITHNMIEREDFITVLCKLDNIDLTEKTIENIKAAYMNDSLVNALAAQKDISIETEGNSYAK
ncbi:hypothetical protein [Staphylococcus simulans]|uniref:hypothetical protein n=1 Tax=Staphylococcus simulans TaxID=1286 RepID=UPI000F6F2D7C|nr:hypothetical protein [Staphylococcus simulans]VED60414.1 Uncharacterised protein [Staphylococcus simulans]